MRIKEKIVKKGLFWLPENAERKISGVLTISDGGYIELETFGIFDDNFSSLEPISRIIGEANGKFITLNNCLYRTRSFSSINTAKIFVNQAFIGVAYEKDEEPMFDSLSFSVDCLDEWVGITGANIKKDFKNQTTTINYVLPKNITHYLDNAMQLEICFDAFTPYLNITEIKIKQRVYFKLTTKTLKPLNDFLEIVFRLTELLCFAVNTVVTFKDLKAFRTFDNKPYLVPIYIYYKSTLYSEKIPKINLCNILFIYKTIKDNAQNIFNKWIKAYETLSPALSLYFSVEIGSQKYHDEKFLALTRGLEAYHKGRRSEKLKNPNKKVEKIFLSQRIIELLEPFKRYFGSQKERTQLVQKIVNTRNYFTHYSEHLKDKCMESIDLFYLCQEIKFLFQMHFLKMLDFSDDEINKINEQLDLVSYKLGKKE